MKTKYKLIRFKKMSHSPKVWLCKSNKSNSIMGIIEYYKPWKQFIFQADCTAVFSAVFSRDCLLDIADFMKQLEESEVEDG